MKEEERRAIVAYRIERARTTYDEVEKLIAAELWNTAMNRLYYATYYAAIALLASRELFPATHNGVRQLLGLHFIKTSLISQAHGELFSTLFDKRHSSDYNDFVDMDRERLMPFIVPAGEMIRSIEELLKNNVRT